MLRVFASSRVLVRQSAALINAPRGAFHTLNHNTRVNSHLPQHISATFRNRSSLTLAARASSSLVLPSSPYRAGGDDAASRSLFPSLRQVIMYSSVLGAIYVAYENLMFPRNTAPSAEIVLIPEPPSEFVHPLFEAPWYKRMFIATKRFIYLSFLFAPCAAIGIIAHITKDDGWRKYWLEKLVSAFEAAGCGFQKFGQWISMRPDMFPQDVVQTMSRLRENIPPHSFAHTERMIAESFGRPLSEIFESFDETPIASGTVAQVHRARLRPEFTTPGQSADVAVKVRHPSVLEETFVDVDLLFATMETSRILALPFEREDFLSGLQKQINFEWEAHSLSKFAHNFKHEVDQGLVVFPTVVPQLLSQCVLVESWINGSTVGDFFAEVGDGFREIGNKVADAFREKRHNLTERMFGVCMKMFLRDDFMHGDLHAGNVMYHPESNALVVLDAGHTTTLGTHLKPQFGVFMRGLISGNSKDITESIVAFNKNTDVQIDRVALQADIQASVDRFMGPDGKAHDGGPACVGDLLGNVMFKLQKHQVSLRADVAGSIMAIAVAEGLIRQMEPDFDMNMNALPYLARYGL